MKNFYLTILLSTITITGFSQFHKSANDYQSKYGTNESNLDKFYHSAKSPSTALFLGKINNEKTNNKDSLYKHLPIVKKNEVLFVKAFVIATNGTDLKKLGFIESLHKGRIRTGLIEVDKVEKLSQSPAVQYIEIATPIKPLLDDAVKSANVDKAHAGISLPQGFTGDGVVVGIIDVGFDYTHPSFYDSTGTSYRVKRVWEQSSTTGTPPNGYTYGRELSTQNSILSAQTDNSGESHGSHVAGIAAGSGAGTSDLYRGVAFESDIVLVSTDFTNLGIAEGVDYVIKYANSVNKPCVINMSLGSHVGSHDGLSALDQVFDSLAGNGKLIVGAAGNEGQDSIYIGKSYTGNDSLMVSFINFPESTLGTNGTGLIDIWGEPNQHFTVAVNIYNTNTDQVEDFTPYISSSSNNSFNYTIQDGDIFADDCIVAIATETNPLNNKPHVTIEIDHTDQDDNYRWALIEIIAHGTTTKMWANSSYFTSNGYASPFEQGSTNSTVGEIGGTGKNVISVGAYTTTNSYTNFSGSQQTIPAFAPLEEIAPFSSKGPTADNRTKPDITAPGNVVIAPVNSFDQNYNSTTPEVAFSVTNGTKDWYFASLEGTSMASPMVTGVLALWLEANTNLSPTNVKNIIKNNARTDAFTGTIPTNGNNTWGWGKIDAVAGLVNIVSIDENSLKSGNIVFYPNPNYGDLLIDVSELSGVTFRIVNLVGQLVQEDVVLNKGLNRFDLQSLQNGAYLMMFQKDGVSYSERLIIAK